MKCVSILKGLKVGVNLLLILTELTRLSYSSLVPHSGPILCILTICLGSVYMVRHRETGSLCTNLYCTAMYTVQTSSDERRPRVL